MCNMNCSSSPAKMYFLGRKAQMVSLVLFFIPHGNLNVYTYFCKIEWSIFFWEAWFFFFYNCYSTFLFLVTMLNADFCVDYSTMENMIVQQESVSFKKDKFPAQPPFFFFNRMYATTWTNVENCCLFKLS